MQPVVLVGGRSRRFGRDKLREPMPDGAWLVDRPIAALRLVFGPRVALVGSADSSVLARGDAVIEDRLAGVGPVGGILSALRSLRPPLAAVFVLAGDLPAIDAVTVRRIVIAADRGPDAWAVLAKSERVEPCVGIYRVTAIPALEGLLATPDAPLGSAIPEQHRRFVDVDAARLANLNTLGDLASAREREGTS